MVNEMGCVVLYATGLPENICWIVGQYAMSPFMEKMYTDGVACICCSNTTEYKMDRCCACKYYLCCHCIDWECAVCANPVCAISNCSMYRCGKYCKTCRSVIIENNLLDKEIKILNKHSIHLDRIIYGTNKHARKYLNKLIADERTSAV
jgi:hypothetical protein